MGLRGDIIAVALAGAVLAAAAWYAKNKLAKAAEKVQPYVNPFDDRNLANQTAIGLYQAVTGSKGTIGTDLYDGVQTIKQRFDETDAAVRAQDEYGWAL